MKADFWHTRWQDNRIGFHQSRTNTRLEQFWPSLQIDTALPVFVPLCGKSLDMLMLHERGHPVIGVELSRLAVEAFFAENQLPYDVHQSGNLQEFTGTGVAAGLRLFAGDMFALETAQIGAIGGFYDRASLIAMPPEMRAQYVDKLATLLPTGAIGLLISLEYDPTKMKGPPFSVPDADVQSLFAGNFVIEPIDHSDGPERLGSLKERGLDTMKEHVYRLQRT